MPGLLQRCAQFGNGPAGSLPSNAIWSKHRDEITFDQLQKFWGEMPLAARQELLRIDKQTLFEQARKNLYCSRCNGLLLEGFTQIVMYCKSLQQDGVCVYPPSRAGSPPDRESDCLYDPSVHPWGGLATTRDGILTLLDCFINAKSLKALQNVFDNARARERERELLYPDACGGGGRGWISQGMANYGRGHGARDTCALHTARLSCDTLVDFWSALSDETRSSLLRMKEEDFVERLMYRFDSKRFCRDCRRNVIREFKELKELKRMRREPRCSSWFCVADTAFQYEVLEDTVQADWHQAFTDTIGTYHHFEWAVGTGEGKSDILEFEDVGMNGKVQVNGLDLVGLSACFITLRAWKLDGRCTELCVKAHALKEQPCVHRRLIVGDGFVTITKGESIRRFFEHAEEAEEDEDDDAIDKDGNEYDGDGSRPQKHAKSPELAREFLLDAATVIFKDQVEKAFREGTARQNAHSIFVCLALKLLEERIHVACKEIITLEKQVKLLEEEEREKREEEERKERRRTKDREKKLRRKERLKGKERERERKHTESNSHHFGLSTSNNDSSSSTHDDSPNAIDSGDSISDPGDSIVLTSPTYPDSTNEKSLDCCINTKNVKTGSLQNQFHVDEDGNDSFVLEQSKSSRRKLMFKIDTLSDPPSKWSINGTHRPSRERVAKSNPRNCNLKFSEKFHCLNSRVRDRNDFQSCNCSQGDRRANDGHYSSSARSNRDIKGGNKIESSSDMRPVFRSTKYNHGCSIPDSCVIPKRKPIAGTPSRDVFHSKQVWEPMDARKKCTRSNSDPDISVKGSVKSDLSEEGGIEKGGNECDQPCKSSDNRCSIESSGNPCKLNVSSSSLGLQDSRKDIDTSGHCIANDCHNEFVPITKSDCYSKDNAEVADSCPRSNASDTVMNASSSDNCSSCPSEGDGSTSSSSVRNAESSSTSDSEDASQHSDGRYVPPCEGNGVQTFADNVSDSKIIGDSPFTTTSDFSVASCTGNKYPREEATSTVSGPGNGRYGIDLASQHHLPLMHNPSMHVPLFPSPILGYHNQNAASWPTAPANGLVPFTQPSHYMLPSPFGYGLAANQSSDFCMQYNMIQHVTPVLSLHQHSSHQTSRSPYAESKEHFKNMSSSGVQQVNFASESKRSMHERLFPNRLPPEQPSVGQNGSIGIDAKPRDDAPSFSLFHFGGPVAGAAGYSVNPDAREGDAGGLVSNIPAVQAATCSKEETAIEQYSLFASSNAARFSFFEHTLSNI